MLNRLSTAGRKLLVAPLVISWLLTGMPVGAATPEPVCCVAPTGPAQAVRPPISQPVNGVVVLDFEGLRDNEAVLNFYDGGLGGAGTGPGPDFGITFSSSSLALIDSDAGGSGNIGGEPSPSTTLYFLTSSAIMNVPAGFRTGFSFFYSAPFFTGVIRVFSGPNGTGTMLAELPLALTPASGAPDPNGQYSPLVAIGVSFSGEAQSVEFGGTPNFIVYDDITIGSATPGLQSNPTAPAASGAALAGLAAVLGVWGAMRLRAAAGATRGRTRR